MRAAQSEHGRASNPLHVLVTGALGNLGIRTLDELVSRGHSVTASDVPSSANRRRARRYESRAKIAWGDIRDAARVREVVAGRDAVIHLAAVLPPFTETHPEAARAINVGGTRNVLDAMVAGAPEARLVFTSSVSVFGLAFDRPPPRTVDDPVVATDNYTAHKIECEALVRKAPVRALILRVGPSVDANLNHGSAAALRDMFEVRPDNRAEFLHVADAARAFVNAIERDDVWGRTLLLGGGPSCRIRQRDLVGGALEAVGLGPIPDAAFGDRPFYTDWMDCEETERLLAYQRHSFADHLTEVAHHARVLRALLRPIRPLVRAWILTHSRPWRERRRRRSEPR